MKNLVVLGCSYSALYYHPNPDYSYTSIMAERLNVENVYNLACAGAAPESIIQNYELFKRSKAYTEPDFIFIQIPSKGRHSVDLKGYIQDLQAWKKSDKHIFYCPNAVDFNNCNTNLLHKFKLIVDINSDIDFLKDTLLPWRKNFETFDNFCITVKGSDVTSNSRYSNDINSIIAQKIFYLNDNDETVNELFIEEVNCIVNYFEKVGIPFAFVESDEYAPSNSKGLLSTLVDKQHRTACEDLIVKKIQKYFIKDVSINKGSHSHVDDYDDGHPGKDSHNRFADKLIPKLAKFIK